MEASFIGANLIKKINRREYAKRIVFFKRLKKYSTTKMINKIEKN